MAYRYQNNSKTHHRVPAYYAENNLYPEAYSRNEWPTRTSRRVHDGFSLTANYGLDTVSDDLNSSEYSSPYYINGRYNIDNHVAQRGNSASVQGIKRLLDVYSEVDDFTEDDIQTTIPLWQGKQIKFSLPYSGKIVGNTITLKNTEGCTGILSIYLSAKDGGKPLYETSIDLCKVSEDKFEHFTLYGATPVDEQANPKGTIYVRMEIWDELDSKRSTNPFNTGRKIEIAASGQGHHDACEYTLPNKNQVVNTTYDYSRYPNQPLMGLVYNSFSSVPVDKIADEKSGGTVSLNGYRYDIFCVKDSTHAEILIYDHEMNQIIDSDIRVDARVEQVFIAQCTDTNQQTWVYYVDGYSPLQKFIIGEWVSEALPVGSSDDSEDANPVIGASLIMFHNNRLYLAGFRRDGNLMQISSIESYGADFDSFPYRVYVPNRSPYDTSLNNITGMAEYLTDEIMICGKSFFTLFTTNVNIEDGTPEQVSSYMDMSGVASQGDIVAYKGIIYSFDPREGIRRFNGDLWQRIPNAIDSHFDRVDMDKPRKLWGYANKVYLNYTDKVDGRMKCLVWDMKMEYSQYPWFQDVDIPFCDVRTNNTEDLIGIHPDYPCIMLLYAEDTWARLDTPIVFERHTKHITIPGNNNDLWLKRVHTKVLANCNRIWDLAITVDKHDLTQTRGNDLWFRKPCWATLEVEEPVETPFYDNDVYEEDAVARLSINQLRVKGSSVQLKARTKTFRDQASLLSVLFEVQPILMD